MLRTNAVISLLIVWGNIAEAQGAMEAISKAKPQERVHACDEVRGYCPTTVRLGEIEGKLELSIHVIEPIGDPTELLLVRDATGRVTYLHQSLRALARQP